MLGSSRESLAACSAALDARRQAAGIDELSAQVFAVAALLDDNAQLRSTLADSGQPASVRESLIRDILANQVSAVTLDVVADVVDHRWSDDIDLVIALEQLAAQAAFTVAEGNGTLDATEEEIFRFGRAIDASAELQMALGDPARSAQTKAAIVRDLLSDRATAATREVLESTVGRLHGQRLDAAIDTLWSAVVPSAHLLAHFVDEGGVIRLLSALEAAPFAPRAHLLSCLADTLAHAPAAAQCHEWRGSKGQRALGLLLSLWAEEEARLGAASNNGMLASAQRPLEVSGGQMLRSLQQSLHSDDSDDEVAASGGAGAGGQLGGREAAESLRLTTMAGLSIAGRFDGVGTKEAAPLESHDLRAKVYAAMAALDFGEAAEGGDLDSAQALTLAAVKEYVAFCEAETWRDIAEELDAESTRPITADGERLDQKLDLAESRAHDVIATQRAHAQRIYAGGDALQEAMLSRIRVLRDGPMAGMGRSAKRAGVSLFRARLEAKNRIGEMVAASRREYTGPKPTAIEYVDAVLEQQLDLCPRHLAIDVRPRED